MYRELADRVEQGECSGNRQSRHVLAPTRHLGNSLQFPFQQRWNRNRWDWSALVRGIRSSVGGNRWNLLMSGRPCSEPDIPEQFPDTRLARVLEALKPPHASPKRLSDWGHGHRRPIRLRRQRTNAIMQSIALQGSIADRSHPTEPVKPPRMLTKTTIRGTPKTMVIALIDPVFTSMLVIASISFLAVAIVVLTILEAFYSFHYVESADCWEPLPAANERAG